MAYTKMNPEVKALWLEALRGGEYEQGKGYLRREKLNDDGTYYQYCCLGVLCDLAVEEGVIEEPEESSYSPEIAVYRDGYEGEETVLPEAVAKWAGLMSEGEYGHVGTNKGGKLNEPIVISMHDDVYDEWREEHFPSLWELNDSAEYTFEQMAGVIEEQF